MESTDTYVWWDLSVLTVALQAWVSRIYLSNVPALKAAISGGRRPFEFPRAE